MSNINLKEEAASTGYDGAVKGLITEDDLLDVCPKSFLTRFKKAKTPAARADFLYKTTHKELSELKKAFKEVDDFLTKLEQWFIQEMAADQTGVSGKVGRVEVKKKEVASVEDWDKFYAHIKKKGEFDLLNRAVNQKSVKLRWEQGKAVPGVGTFPKSVISLTQVKGK